MKQIKIIVTLILTLAIVVGSLTSCDVLEGFGIDLDSILGNNGTNGGNENNNGEENIDPSTCGHYVTKVQNKVSATCSNEGYTGDTVCYACGTVITPGKAIDKTEHSYKDGVCSACGEKAPGVQIPEDWAQYTTITIAEALALCEEFVSSPSTDRYYIIATVKSVDDTAYGKLMIEDETGEIMVYGTNSADGSLKYDQMGGDLKAGDVILIYGTLQNYKGTTKEVQNAWLIDYVAVESAPVEPTITPDSTVTIADIIANAALVDETVRFYVTATVQSIKNAAYGEMYIEDATGEIYVYGCYSEDGSIGYAAMEDKPYKGDTVTLYVTIGLFNGTAEIKNARIISFTHNEIEFNENDYTEMTVDAARETAKGSLVKVSGVVAKITYANGYVPSGFYLIDNTNSIYVYDGQIAARVAEGNTVTVYAEKDFWILGTEETNANKFGYTGCNQLTNVVNFTNDEGNTAFDTSWITESTVKEIMDTPVSENITTTIFKVTALIKKAPGTGFTNYYIDDIDGHTGSYVYTQCNGGDFAWLDEFDGKFCTVYLSAINAKSSTSGCVWRFLPVAVIDEGYTFDVNEAPKYAVTYHGLTQFLASYTGDPAIVLETLVSSELLGFEGATLTYASSDENVVYFTNENGVITFHGKDAGTATITVSASHGNNTYSETIEITIKENIAIDSITVADAIATPFDTDVVVKGIVGPSLVNRDGFYLFGEDGSMIAVIVSSKDAFEGLAIGNEIVISGMRERFIKDDTYTTYGQDAIVNAVIVANYYGNHEYSTEKFITDKNLAHIAALDATVSHSTEVYILTATVKVVDAQYYSNIYLVDGETELLLYCSSASQYNWLKAYNGQAITVEVAPCNWNDKTNYRGCVLAVVLEDGSKIYNTLNFGN